MQNSNDKTECDTPDIWLRTLKAGKCQAVLAKLW